MSLTLSVIIGLLLAAGIILVFTFLTVAKFVEKLKEKHDDFFKAKIKRKYEKFGVEVIDVDIKDAMGNDIASETYASPDGISDRLYTGIEINKYSS